MIARKRQLWAWALYDCANSGFAVTVAAGFFPLFFKEYWSAGASTNESTFRLGQTNSAAALVIAFSAPLLGAIADKGRAKKRLLACFAAFGAIATACLSLVADSSWQAAALCYGAASIGFGCSLIFYDSLLVAVSDSAGRDRASALGYAMGYLGGGLLFALNVAMVLAPQRFGLADEAQAVRISFVLCAVWWVAFTLPLLRAVHEPPSSQLAAIEAVRAGWAQLLHTSRRIAGMRSVWRFLIAYWLYIDGVNTVVTMAIDYGLSLGFSSSSLTLALLITQFVGFPAALAFGAIGAAIGSKRALLIAVTSYIAVMIWAYRMTTEHEFYGVAVAVGLVQGGVQALSRSLYSRLIPSSSAGEFFGFYNMLTKFAAILGPSLVGWVSLITGNSRLAILSLITLFAGGCALLLLVDDVPASSARGLALDRRA